MYKSNCIFCVFRGTSTDKRNGLNGERRFNDDMVKAHRKKVLIKRNTVHDFAQNKSYQAILNEQGKYIRYLFGFYMRIFERFTGVYLRPDVKRTSLLRPNSSRRCSYVRAKRVRGKALINLKWNVLLTLLYVLMSWYLHE